MQLLWNTVWWLPKTLNIEILSQTYNYTAIPLLHIDPKELKTGVQTNTCTQMFISALFTIAKT